MSKVYLVNVGANTSHSAVARSPIFNDGSFIFVPFPLHVGKRGTRPCPVADCPFVRKVDVRDTHSDPDWRNLTYGDHCANPRAKALLRVVEDDILLFWALLWRNRGGAWEDGFTGEQRWCLIGALRVREILASGQSPSDANASRRARLNAHFRNEILGPSERVFVGCTRYSRLFSKAVDLEVTKRSGLLYRTLRTAHGAALRLKGRPHWSSSLRSCRAIWDLEKADDRRRAEIVRDAILRRTGYDLLAGLSPADDAGLRPKLRAYRASTSCASSRGCTGAMRLPYRSKSPTFKVSNRRSP